MSSCRASPSASPRRQPHKIEWTEAFGGSVCKLGECLEAIESGLIDIGDAHAPFEPAKMLAHNFAYLRAVRRARSARRRQGGARGLREHAGAAQSAGGPLQPGVRRGRHRRQLRPDHQFQMEHGRRPEGPQDRRRRPEPALAAGHRRGRRAVDAERGLHLDADRRLRRLGDVHRRLDELQAATRCPSNMSTWTSAASARRSSP